MGIKCFFYWVMCSDFIWHCIKYFVMLQIIFKQFDWLIGRYYETILPACSWSYTSHDFAVTDMLVNNHHLCSLFSLISVVWCKSAVSCMVKLDHTLICIYIPKSIFKWHLITNNDQ
jgi:hypothetical protein